MFQKIVSSFLKMFLIVIACTSENKLSFARGDLQFKEITFLLDVYISWLMFSFPNCVIDIDGL